MTYLIQFNRSEERLFDDVIGFMFSSGSCFVRYNDGTHEEIEDVLHIAPYYYNEG